MHVRSGPIADFGIHAVAGRSGTAHIAAMVDEPEFDRKIETLMRCQRCNREMRLLGIEPFEPTRELYTFECDRCGLTQVRGVRIA